MITKDEQSKLRSTIALLSSMVNGGEQHSERSRKEVSEALSIVNNLPIQRVSNLLCGFFEADTSNSSATICKHCGREKWEHPKTT
jgi:hypothetical protein